MKRLRIELRACGSQLTITAQPNVIGEWDRFRREQVVSSMLSNVMKFGLGKPLSRSPSRPPMGVGGSVRVEGKLGAGSTFIVELPLRSTPETTDANPGY